MIAAEVLVAEHLGMAVEFSTLLQHLVDDRRRSLRADRTLAALNEVPDADAEETLNAVRRAVDTFVGNAAQFDDLTMMCIVYHGTEHAQVPEIKGEGGNEA